MNEENVTGSVETIHIAERGGGELVELDAAELLPGRGISGDRHCKVLDPDKYGIDIPSHFAEA